MKTKYIFGIIVILIFLVFAGINFSESLTPYVSFSTAKKKGTTVQVKGQRVIGSEHYDAASQTFRFEMSDESGETFQVAYAGVKPSNFEQAKEVVAIGRYHNGAFEAEELLVKCPSKYEAEGVAGVAPHPPR